MTRCRGHWFIDLLSLLVGASASLPFVERDFGAPVVEGPSDVDLFSTTCPADHSWPGLRAGLDRVVRIRAVGHEVFFS